MAGPHSINTKDAATVAEFARQAFTRMGADKSLPLVTRLFSDVTRMFQGNYPGFQAIDMQFHDFEHTLQATVCLLDIIQGRLRSGTQPALSARDHELALMSVLLHDCGYLKRTDDKEGTGAKYTLIHVQRSCDFARIYLPGLGVSPLEIEDVTLAISCTGPINKIDSMAFRRPESKLLACILVTADYLGQMSASDYVSELPILYREFSEAYEYDHIPEAKRVFHNERELVEKTPAFWEKYVRPLLDGSAGGMYRFANRPDGTNPYIQSIEANIAAVRQMNEARTPAA